MNMKSGIKSLILLLALLGIADLAIIPFAIAGGAPVPVLILSAAYGIATLATIRGALQGRRWAFWVAIACRGIDILNSVGAVLGGAAQLKVVGGLTIVLSIAAIVLLVQVNRNRGLEGATVGG
jgi:hypothetical protein